MGSFEFKIYFLIQFSNLKLTFANDISKWPRWDEQFLAEYKVLSQYVKRDLLMSKETYQCQKRPISVKRDLSVAVSCRV